MHVSVSVVYCITWDPYSIPKSLSGAKNMMVIFGRPLRSVELITYNIRNSQVILGLIS